MHPDSIKKFDWASHNIFGIKLEKCELDPVPLAASKWPLSTIRQHS
jgi:hypothetical protein